MMCGWDMNKGAHFCAQLYKEDEGYIGIHISMYICTIACTPSGKGVRPDDR